MAISAIPASQFAADLIAFVTAYNLANKTNYDVRQGTALTDILINGPAAELATLSRDLVYASEIPSLNYADILVPSDLDNIGANWGKTRNPATYSVGAVTFIATSQPTSNIPINAGITASTNATLGSNSVQFQTIESVIMSVATLSAYQVPAGPIMAATTWQITVPVSASVVGLQGNVAANTIRNMNQPIQGISLVTNALATLGGTDDESNTAFAARIRLALTGNNIGTSDGIISLARSNSTITGVCLAGPTDPAMLRNQYGGSIDIYVLGANRTPAAVDNPQNLLAILPATSIETPVYLSSAQQVPLQKAPVISVVSVTGLVSGTPTNFVVGTQAIFVKDTNLLAGSSKETSFVTFPTGLKPDNNTNVQVTTNYDSLIPALQATFDLSQNHVDTADLLVRECAAVTVNVYSKVGMFSGYTVANVQSAIVTNVSAFINSQPLGQSVKASDILDVIDRTPGVNGVDIPSFTPADDITITSNQVVVVGTIHGQIGATYTY